MINNLVLVALPNGMTIVGMKFGHEIKKPMMIAMQEKGQGIEFTLRFFPFVGKTGSITLGAGYSFFHTVTDKVIEDTYAKATSTIIVPEVGLATGYGGTKQ